MIFKIANFLLFVAFSAIFLPLMMAVYLLQPFWEDWSKGAFDLDLFSNGHH